MLLRIYLYTGSFNSSRLSDICFTSFDPVLCLTVQQVVFSQVNRSGMAPMPWHIP